MATQNPLCEKYRGTILLDSEGTSFIIVSDNNRSYGTAYSLFEFNHGYHIVRTDGLDSLTDEKLIDLRLTTNHTNEPVGWERKYYKVVSYVKGQLTSFMTRNSEVTVVYKVGEFVKPLLANSKLFVFDDLSHARMMAGCRGYIYECEIKNPEKPNPRIAAWYNVDEIRTYWREGIERLPRSCRTPFNTVLCDEVKLIKEITY